MSEQHNDPRSLWLERRQQWQARLDAAGLGELARGIEQGLKPLGPLAAQILWFSQPGFALFGAYEAVGALADLLDHPPDGPGAPSHDG